MAKKQCAEYFPGSLFSILLSGRQVSLNRDGRTGWPLLAFNSSLKHSQSIFFRLGTEGLAVHYPWIVLNIEDFDDFFSGCFM